MIFFCDMITCCKTHYLQSQLFDKKNIKGFVISEEKLAYFAQLLHKDSIGDTDLLIARAHGGNLIT